MALGKIFVLFVGLSVCCAREGSTKGRQFMVTFMHNGDTQGSPSTKSIYVSPEERGSVDIYALGVRGGGVWSNQTMMQPGTIVKIDVPDELEMVQGTGIAAKGIMLTLTGNASVYAFSENKVAISEDVYNVLPVPSLSKAYTIPSVPVDPAFIVVSVKDFTHVNITFNTACQVKLAGKTYTGGESVILTLHIFEVLQVSLKGACDLAGTHIIADNAVAVTSGSTCASLKVDQKCSHLVEQVHPTELWGRRYIVPSLDDVNDSMLRIISARDTLYTSITQHYKDGTSHTISHPIFADEAHQMTIPAGAVTEIFTSEKLHVSKFGLGPNPYALSIPSVESYSWNYTVAPIENHNSYISILAYTSQLDSLTINGLHSQNHMWTKVLDLGYSIGVFPLTITYRIEASHPFMVQVYGSSPSGSAFAFNAGTKFDYLPSETLFIDKSQFPSTARPQPTTQTPSVTTQQQTTTLPTTALPTTTLPTTTVPTTTVLTTSIPTTTDSSGSSDCMDVVNDCAKLDKDLQICSQPSAAMSYCKKYCNLCSNAPIIG